MQFILQNFKRSSKDKINDGDLKIKFNIYDALASTPVMFLCLS
jgi:hypothetical protein